MNWFPIFYREILLFRRRQTEGGGPTPTFLRPAVVAVGVVLAIILVSAVAIGSQGGAPPPVQPGPSAEPTETAAPTPGAEPTETAEPSESPGVGDDDASPEPTETVIATLGSTLWVVASQGLWQHGPAALALTVAITEKKLPPKG